MFRIVKCKMGKKNWTRYTKLVQCLDMSDLKAINLIFLQHYLKDCNLMRSDRISQNSKLRVNHIENSKSIFYFTTTSLTFEHVTGAEMAHWLTKQKSIEIFPISIGQNKTLTLGKLKLKVKRSTSEASEMDGEHKYETCW